MWACANDDCKAAVAAKFPDNVTIARTLESPTKEPPQQSKKRKTINDAQVPESRNLRPRPALPAPNTKANNKEHTQTQDKSGDENSEAKATHNNKNVMWGLPVPLKDKKLEQRLVEQRLEFFDYVKLPGSKKLEFKTGDYLNVTVQDKNMNVVVVAVCRHNQVADKRKTPDYRVQVLLNVGNGKEFPVEDLVMVKPGKCDVRSVTIVSKGTVELSDDKQTELLQKYIENKRPVQGVSWSDGLNWFYNKTEASVSMQLSGKGGAKKTSTHASKSKKPAKATKAAASTIGVRESELREYINSAIAKSNGANMKQVTDKISQALAANKKQYSEMNRLIKQGSKASGSLDPALKKLGLEGLKANQTLLGQVNAVPLNIKTSIDTAQKALTETMNTSTSDVKAHTSTVISTAINTSTNELKSHTTTEMQSLKYNFQQFIDSAVEKALEIQRHDVEMRHRRELDLVREMTYLQGQMSMVNEGIHPRSIAYDPTRAIANSQPGWTLAKSTSSSSSPITFSPALPSAQQNSMLRPSNSPTSYNTNSNPYTAHELDTQSGTIYQHDLHNLTVQHRSNPVFHQD
jgi:hypothetical protein